MDQGLEIVHQRVNGIDIIHLSGTLAFCYTNAVWEKLHSLIKESRGVLKILLNLKDVSFIDASGIRVLIEIYKAAKQFNTQIVLSELRPKPWRLMRIAGITRIIEFFKTDSEALHYFQNLSPENN